MCYSETMSLYAPEIASIGGGTGNFVILSHLKEFTPYITGVPAMADDGSSTGELVDQMGVLPMGDARQCLVALSNLPNAREMFTYRPEKGPAKNHPTGNIILSNEEERLGDLQKAIDVTGEMMQITGQVTPVSLRQHRLVMRDGHQVIMGESAIEEHNIIHPDATVHLEPKAPINPRAAEAILRANVVVLTPSDVYGSRLAALCVDGMKEVINESNAKLVLVANLMNKPGKTEDWHAVDEAHKVGEYIGEDRLDYVIYNKRSPSPRLRVAYAQDGEYPVGTSPERFKEIRAKAIGAALVSRKIYAPLANDTKTPRTIIRHDGLKVSHLLMELHYSTQL